MYELAAIILVIAQHININIHNTYLSLSNSRANGLCKSSGDVTYSISGVTDTAWYLLSIVGDPSIKKSLNTKKSVYGIL